MESGRNEAMRKRMKPNMEEKEEDHVSNETVMETTEKEQSETNIVGSEEMELNISHIFEKIERFTQLVSELLESWKTMFKELSEEFEERLIMIHKEHMDKWQEEINELRLVDGSNGEASAMLNNARSLLQNPLFES
ncbi:uncharacterized protein LOC110413380 [Herrania umbratica]|uniref:Uncharacterized protein LOC110413380 n=1 Tax=Herrania umbratica TaxID=108875 RepID=A0A6J0ZZ38_9ROSI|nr:uncharacterized protein LOC110413380 [Herrania umbratica]XP_021279830.1 uncharacterized protein LOC110413380 [Herrania umbratica]XP_021279831.1 uncharacterized protein LOC110413380 [Herrania umbratica]